MSGSRSNHLQSQARRVAAAIAAIIIAGSSLDRALAATPGAKPTQASRQESTGVLSGFAIGAAAGGPFGAIAGAAAGGWLGDRMHRQATEVRALARSLSQQERERARLVAEIETLNTSLAKLDTQLRAAQANSMPLDELAASVHFRTRDASLLDADAGQLRQLGKVLAARTHRKIHVTGFADARGAAGYNYELSTARAEAVADAMVEGGLPRDQLVVIGAGAPSISDCLVDADHCAFERRVTVSMVAGVNDVLAQVAP